MRSGDLLIALVVRPGLAAAIAILAVFPVLANVTFTTGDYKAACSQPDENWKSFCSGYAQAVVDIANATGTACVPDGTTHEDVVILIEAMTFEKIGTQQFPETQAAIMMALAVVNSIFPCDR